VLAIGTFDDPAALTSRHHDGRRRPTAVGRHWRGPIRQGNASVDERACEVAMHRFFVFGTLKAGFPLHWQGRAMRPSCDGLQAEHLGVGAAALGRCIERKVRSFAGVEALRGTGACSLPAAYPT
jgi:hypothetical protein